MVTPHWPSYRRAGLGDASSCPVPLDGNGNCPTDDLAAFAQAGAEASASGVVNLSNPGAQIQGTATAAYQQITNAAQPLAALSQGIQSQVGQAAGAVKTAYQGYASQIQTIENYPGASEAASGMITAASGGTPSDAEIQGGFTVVACAAAVALGTTATVAAACVAPMAAVVFGAGYALGDLLCSVFGWGKPIPCGGDNGQFMGTDPSDPKWETYMGFNGPMRGQPMGRYSAAQAGNVAQMKSVAGNPDGAPADWPFWMPYTRGAFENWARPLIIHAEELWANCKAVPPDNTATSFLKGLVGAWNAQAQTNGPVAIREISLVGLGSTPLDVQARALSNTTFQTSFRPPLYWQLMAWGGDPVQMLMEQVSAEQGANISIRVANSTPAAAAAPAAPLGTTGKVVVGTAAVGGAALIGTAVYALAKGQAVETVLKAGWFSLKGWFSR